MGSIEKKFSYSLEVWGAGEIRMTTRLEYSNPIHFASLSPRKLAIRLIYSKHVLLNFNHIFSRSTPPKKYQTRKENSFPWSNVAKKKKIVFLNFSLQALFCTNKH